MRKLLVLLAICFLAGAAAPTPTGRGVFDALFGTYVGRAVETDLAGHMREERDIDIIIAPYGEEGATVTWTNVTLVNGRRDVPGVERHSDEIILAPAPERSFYLAGAGYDPFKNRGQPNVLAGDALRWATLAGPRLDVYSFLILPDGSYELQVYERARTPEGIALSFHRYVDGELVRRMAGTAVRTE